MSSFPVAFECFYCYCKDLQGVVAWQVRSVDHHIIQGRWGPHKLVLKLLGNWGMANRPFTFPPMGGALTHISSPLTVFKQVLEDSWSIEVTLWSIEVTLSCSVSIYMAYHGIRWVPFDTTTDGCLLEGDNWGTSVLSLVSLQDIWSRKRIHWSRKVHL